MASQDRFDDLESKHEKALDESSISQSSSSEVDVKVQIERESGHAIKYRSCSWQKVRTRLDSEQQSI